MRAVWKKNVLFCKKKNNPGCHRDTGGIKAWNFCKILLLLNEHGWPSAATQPWRRKISNFPISSQLTKRTRHGRRWRSRQATMKSSSQKKIKRSLPRLTICSLWSPSFSAALEPPLGKTSKYKYVREVIQCVCSVLLWKPGALDLKATATGQFLKQPFIST